MKRGTGASRSSPTCRGGSPRGWKEGRTAAPNARSKITPMSAGLSRAVAITLLAVALHGCAEKIVPPPVVTTPKYPEFVRPAVAPSEANTSAAINEGRAWQFLQAGDLKT